MKSCNGWKIRDYFRGIHFQEKEANSRNRATTYPRQRGASATDGLGPAAGGLGTGVFFLPLLPRAGQKRRGRGRAAGDVAAGSGGLRPSRVHLQAGRSLAPPFPARGGAGEAANDDEGGDRRRYRGGRPTMKRATPAISEEAEGTGGCRATLRSRSEAE